MMAILYFSCNPFNYFLAGIGGYATDKMKHNLIWGRVCNTKGQQYAQIW